MIKISTDKTFITEKKDVVYKLIDGSVLVFVVASNNKGTILRKKILIAEINDQSILIPSLATKEKFIYDEEELNWNFEIKPLEDSTLKEIHDSSRKIREEFCNKFNIEEMDLLGFEEACIEWYRYQDALDSAKIIGLEYKNTMIEEENKQSIYDVFNRRKVTSFDLNHPLYTAIKIICDYQKINCPDLSIIRRNCGEEYTVNDITRIGYFNSREIKLEKGWQKLDIGPFLSYFKDNNSPIAVLPRNNSYVVFDTTKHDYIKINAEIIENISENAVMLYRSFPKKAIELTDIFKFVIGDFHIGDFLTIILMIALTTIIGLIIPTLNKKIYDLFIPIADSEGLIQFCMVVVACSVGSVMFTIVKSISDIRCFNRIKYSLQAACIDRVFNLPENDIKKYDSGDLASRVTYIGSVFDDLKKLILMPILSFIISIPYLVRMSSYSKKMTKTSLIILLVYIIIVSILSIFRNKYNIKKIDVSNKMKSTVNQILVGINKIRISGAEIRVIDKYFDQYVELADAKAKATTIMNINTILSAALPSISYAIFYFYIVKEGKINMLGDYMAFISAYSAFSGACISMTTNILNFTQDIPMYKKISEILKYEPEVDENNVLPGDIDGSINVEHLSFSYDEKNLVLKDINLNINDGDYVAIVGTSGCGKSTLIKLLLGFQKPTSGKIYYDRKDLASLDKRELRKKLGVVLQNGSLVVGSILDNILLTSQNYKIEDVEKVLEKVALKEDVDKLPMGLNTLLSEGSGGISGGQKQRILIARAIINNPKILFFDEATSALDNISQETVVKSLDELKCTRIVIAHRLSTIMKCDRILVMDKGEFVEDGTYDELMKKKGVFYNLALRQVD